MAHTTIDPRAATPLALALALARATGTTSMGRRSEGRMLSPGEIDDQIDLSPLPIVRPPRLSDEERGISDALVHRYVAPGLGETIPDAAFCDLTKWRFLEDLIHRWDMRLAGANDGGPDHLEPMILARNVHGWHVPRHYAFDNAHDALFRAVLDNRRLRTSGDPTITTITRSIAERAAGAAGHAHYVGLDHRARAHAPWRSGTITIYRRTDLPPAYESVPSIAARPICPLARLRVEPTDWPMLSHTHGIDLGAQRARQRETYRGYPWSDDPTIHPGRWKRELVNEAVSYLDDRFAEPVRLVDLGRHVGVSPFAIQRMFRAEMGISPLVYQARLRVDHAKRLLQRGLAIAHVAANTGFCDQSHLTHHFRAIVRLTPGQYLRVRARIS